MHLKPIKITLFIFAFISLTGFTWGFTKLSDIRMCQSVDPKTQSPINVMETFSPEIPAVFCSAKLSKAGKGTEVGAIFYYLEKEDKPIARLKLPELEGTQYISFSLSPPKRGFPLGRYRVDLYLNNKRKGEVFFSVREKDKPRQKTVAAEMKPVKETPVRKILTEKENKKKTAIHEAIQRAESKGAYRMETDTTHRFSFQIPQNWHRLNPAHDSTVLLLSSNKTNHPVSSMSVQVIPVSMAKKGLDQKAVEKVIERFREQVSHSPEHKILSVKESAVGPVTGKELTFEYLYKGTKLKQSQFLTFHDNRVFIVSLTAEENKFPEQLPHFQNAVASLRFDGKL